MDEAEQWKSECLERRKQLVKLMRAAGLEVPEEDGETYLPDVGWTAEIIQRLRQLAAGGSEVRRRSATIEHRRILARARVIYRTMGSSLHNPGDMISYLIDELEEDGPDVENGAGLSTPEPPPKRTDGAPVWELVIADMRQRDREGRRKYGTPLQAFNGRDALVDAYQEALDLVVYLRQAIEERRANPPITEDEKKDGKIAMGILLDLRSGEECDLDHNGACQAHDWFGEAECPQARLKRLLEDV